MFMQDTYWRNDNGRVKTSLTKYLPLTLLQGFEKVIQDLRVRGSWGPNRTEIFWPPTLMAVSVVSFLFSWCSTGGPESHSGGWWLSLLHLIRNFSGPQLVWFSLPHLVYNSVRSLTATVLTSVLTELYNSSTSTQSPTRSLKSHVWSSSSGNNCHAVHRSLSSGALVYECTMGIFLPRPISSANFRPRDFLSQLPLECVTSFRCITLEWHFSPGRKYNTIAMKWYSAFPKAPALLEPYHQIVLCHIQDTL